MSKVHEDMNTLIAELFTADEGLLPNPVLALNWSRNLSLFPEVTFPVICIYLLGKADEYLADYLKSFKSLTGYRLFKDGHVMDLKTHKVPDKPYVLIKFCVQLTGRSKTGEEKKDRSLCCSESGMAQFVVHSVPAKEGKDVCFYAFLAFLHLDI